MNGIDGVSWACSCSIAFETSSCYAIARRATGLPGVEECAEHLEGLVRDDKEHDELVARRNVKSCN